MMGHFMIAETSDVLMALDLARWALKNDESKIGAFEELAACKRLNDEAIKAIEFLNAQSTGGDKE
tara:strand:- start:2421 stop:2615 length:195 start_codon:yes stop_codon:yes gene_type:complete